MTARSYFLYGEPPREADRHFLHLEPLETRSRPAHWNIRRHIHADLHHLFLIANGRGSLPAGPDPVFRVVAPCLILVPAGVEHALQLSPDSTGRVLTLASPLVSELRADAAEFADHFAAPEIIPAGTEAAFLVAALDRLGHEISWALPARAPAMRGLLLYLFATIARLRSADAQTASLASADARLVARLRDVIEARFHTPSPIGAYAAMLGVSVSRLRAACRNAAGLSPLAMLQARQMQEARHALRHGDVPIREIAEALGYADPAYFIRLFHRLEGTTPGRYRAGTMQARSPARAS